MANALVCERITKTYKNWQLGPIDLSIPLGSVTGIMGLNGSGKTTLMKILGGLIVPGEGTISCSDTPTRNISPSWKSHTCYASQTASFFENWTGKQNLQAFSKFYDHWDWSYAFKLAERFKLDLHTRVRYSSPGNRVKLSLIRALAAQPTILLLDEPSASLDPLVRAELLDTLWETIQDPSKTIVFASHNPLDISQFADHVIFIKNGKISCSMEKEALCEQWAALTLQAEINLSKDSFHAHGIVSTQISNGLTYIKSNNVTKTKKLLSDLHQNNYEIQRLSFETIAVEILKEKG